MKDTKHIRRIFHSVAWVMPKGGTLGRWGAQGVKKKFQAWSYGISNQRGWRADQNAGKIFILGPNWWPWGEIKRSNINKFQRFLYQTLSVFSQMQDTTHIRQDFHSVAWVMPQRGTLGRWGCPGGQKKYFFKTWSCGISNRRGWRAEQKSSKIFILGSNWWPWGVVKISLNYGYHVNFEDFIPNFVCSHK